MLKNIIGRGVLGVIGAIHDEKGDIVSVRFQIGENPHVGFLFFSGDFLFQTSEKTKNQNSRYYFFHRYFLFTQSTTKNEKVGNTLNCIFGSQLFSMDFMKFYFCAYFSLILLGCKPEKKYHDVIQKDAEVFQTDVFGDIFNFQKQLNEEFRNPETSPLPDRFRKDFDGLEFFEPDTNFRVSAKFVRTPEAIPFKMPTTTNRESEEVLYGVAEFNLNGKNHRLEIYQNKELMKEEGYEDYLFLPFADETNGEQTYAGGRYIDLRIPNSDNLVIDFNKAYNPYCVYNKKYSCPLVPEVNALKTKILAGVKDFKRGK